MFTVINKDIMGRIFLAPRDRGANDELYFNIGFNMTGGQKYPDWVPALEPVIPQKRHDEIMGKIKDYLDKNSIPANLPTIALCLSAVPCCCCAGCCICGCYIPSKAKSITKNLQMIGLDYGVRVEVVERTDPTAQTDDAMAFDQYGRALQAMVGGSKHHAGQMKPVWPPLGYNVIMQVPANVDLRSSWGKGAAEAKPAQVVMGNQQQSAAERIAAAQKLKDDGLITAEEFEEKRKQILASV